MAGNEEKASLIDISRFKHRVVSGTMISDGGTLSLLPDLAHTGSESLILRSRRLMPGADRVSTGRPGGCGDSINTSVRGPRRPYKDDCGITSYR